MFDQDVRAAHCIQRHQIVEYAATPNSVASSPTGVLGFAQLYWLAAAAVLLLSNTRKSIEHQDGRLS